MIRRPPRSTRTDTLFPDTTLFRSFSRELSPWLLPLRRQGEAGRGYPRLAAMPAGTPPQPSPAFAGEGAKSSRLKPLLQARLAATLGKHAEPQTRSEERRVGKECVSTGSSRWGQLPTKKNIERN